MQAGKSQVIGTAAAVVAAVAMAGGLVLTRDDPSPSVSDDVARMNAAAAPVSYVKSDNAAVRVALRSCDHATPDEPVDATCFVLDRLPDGTRVTMRCWRDTAPPDARYSSPRWFYITEDDNGLHPGWSGWVYADLVKDQAKVPPCTEPILNAFPMPDIAPLVLDVIVGSCTTGGGELHARSSGFTPGGAFKVEVTVSDNGWLVDEPVDGTVAADGSLPWRFPCGHGEAAPMTYGVAATDVATDRIVFDEVDVPMPATPAPPSSAPAPAPEPGESQPTPPVPPSPERRMITVFNQVTNGPTQMREDGQPAYLSTKMQNLCRPSGCMLEGTAVSTGAQLVAECQSRGVRTTNGNDHDAVDDANPQLYESTLWYGIRWSNDRFGYISEVWISAAYRGGLGLPAC